MKPKEVLLNWVDAFNEGNANLITEMYSINAVNHQVAKTPVIGKKAIHQMFTKAFNGKKKVCIIENIFEDGEWAILEWKDPLGLRGCGFFHIVNDKIIFQRGYWDKLTSLKLRGLPITEL